MEADTLPPANEPQRVQGLWFEDGNLVIQAGNSQFRVYRGVLAARSSVFQDMLAFPQPPDSELVDGCPLVCLPDPATEVTVFLKAIFHPEFFAPFPAPTTFDSIVGVLRLSHKYGVDYLRRRALIHLSSGHHNTLSETDCASYTGDPDPSRSLSEIMSWPGPDSDVSHMCTIQLAREIDAPWVLPLAFYNLSAVFHEVGNIIFHGAVYNGLPVSLSMQDQQTFLIGHNSQNTSTYAAILQFLSYPRSADIEGCKSPARCTAERLNAVESSREMTCDSPSIPLDIWDSDDWDILQDVCPACLAVLKDAHQHARQAFWDKLPEMYGLPCWEELEKMKEAAIGKGCTVL
ncbi:hypothetical protein C8R44DRAFT_707401 [Mycena epipterygia]|nr:hypothetical protein C8R44DRAFT_707401 [Mycena epipterygia]